MLASALTCQTPSVRSVRHIGHGCALAGQVVTRRDVSAGAHTQQRADQVASTGAEDGSRRQSLPLQRRHLIASALLALTACGNSPQLASAAAAQNSAATVEAAGTSGTETVYFGSGCFWGRQHDYAMAEQEVLRRPPQQVSAVAGYAGGAQAGPEGKVCYYYGDKQSVYERLGHAEVVQVNLSSPNPTSAEALAEFRVFADTYFQKQFRRTPFGMSRLDPQDAGSGYRNVIGLPGGVNSPFFQVLKEANVNKMELRAGRGNEAIRSKPTEDDLFNTVWVVDSKALPFYRAEQYHQFHTGIGERFSTDYLRDLRNTVRATGRIDPTGCVETPF